MGNSDSAKIRRIAILPGSFDPFTIGHESLVSRGLELVDEIVIAIGVNNTKQTYFTAEQRLAMISELYKNNQAVRVESYSSLTVDFAKEVGAKFILRGVRTVSDFEYERTIADMNRAISGVDTIVLFTDPALSHVSSSLVRELLKYNHDITPFIPKGLRI